jgi:UDP-N-acetylglucosamine 1-carboxyvinyltransferase
MLEKIIVRGGHRLTGDVSLSGGKNTVLKLMAASVMSKGTCIIRNIPDISDVHTMTGVLRGLGVMVDHSQWGTLIIDASNIETFEAPRQLVKEMRASIQTIGPLLARLGKARVYQPGGCEIGSRPINYHLDGFRVLGAKVTEQQGYIMIEADRLRGAEIHLDFPSVGATENIMAAAVLAEGTTTIHNAAKEPELIEEQNFLNQMGARITGAGTSCIQIEGVNELYGTEYEVGPDRIEAGTFMVAVAITGGEVFIRGAIAEHVEPVIGKLLECGANIRKCRNGILVKGNSIIKPVSIQTMPYPGFPTDMQPQFTAFLALADGPSMITENIFSSRFKHVDEIRRMGSDIRVEGRTIIIRGVPTLSGAEVTATDLRAGAALVLAGLAAEGVTEIEGVNHIDRGYEDFVGKLMRLGADIKRVKVLSSVGSEREKAVGC